MNNIDITNSELKFSGVIGKYKQFLLNICSDATENKRYDPIQEALIEGLASDRANRENEGEPNFEVRLKIRNFANTNFQQKLNKNESDTLSPTSEPFYPNHSNEANSSQEQADERIAVTPPPPTPTDSFLNQPTEQQREQLT